MTTEERNPLDISAQEEADAISAEATRLKQIQVEEDFKWLMGYPQGRRFMWRLLGTTGVFQNPFTPGRDGTTEFRCGQQSIGQTMLTEIHSFCPARYERMVKEQQSK